VRDLFLLRRNVVFLNHGSFGAGPWPVFEADQRWHLELERQPVEFLGRRSRELLRTARRALGEAVGAELDDLVYVPNATTGVKEAPAFQHRLREEFAIEIPVIRWNGRALLRISVQASNGAEDVAALVGAVARLPRR